MRYKEPMKLYDENGNMVSLVFDSNTNEYTDFRSYKKDDDEVQVLRHTLENNIINGHGWNLIERKSKQRQAVV